MLLSASDLSTKTNSAVVLTDTTPSRVPYGARAVKRGGRLGNRPSYDAAKERKSERVAIFLVIFFFLKGGWPLSFTVGRV